MPETLVLPGIDPAVPAAAAAEGNATPSATVDTPAPAGNDAPVNNAPDAQPEPPPAAATTPPPAERDDEGDDEAPRGRRGRGVQRRIEEFRSRAERAEGELAAYRRMQEQGYAQPTRQQREPQGEADPEPLAEQFPTYQQYSAALAAWSGRQEARRLFAERDAAQNAYLQRAREEQAVRELQQGVEQMHSTLGGSMVEASQRYPDYHDVIENSNFNVPPHLEAAIATSDAPGDVAYYLAKNEVVARKLASMHPIQAAHQIARIAHHMTSSRVVSNAPPPARPQPTRGSALNAYPENASPAEHLAWEQRNKGRTQGTAR
jgi:hypothetical protein